MFGGVKQLTNGSRIFTNDLWKYSASTGIWTQLTVQKISSIKRSVTLISLFPSFLLRSNYGMVLGRIFMAISTKLRYKTNPKKVFSEFPNRMVISLKLQRSPSQIASLTVVCHLVWDLPPSHTTEQIIGSFCLVASIQISLKITI